MTNNRILIAKVGLDGHDRGAKIILIALRNAGFEVIYTGLHQSVKSVVRMAIQEDVACIGISAMSASHMTIFPAILHELSIQRASGIFVFGGGIIQTSEIDELLKIGVEAIFTSGTATIEIVSWLKWRLSDTPA
jgi:methylmalonyl-CoA mutase C-terminal domain/subunit